MPATHSDFARFTDSGFTPSRHQIPDVLQALIDCDDEQAPVIERALGRVGLASAAHATQCLEAAPPAARVRLVRLIARVARDTADAALVQTLCERLVDDATTVQRAAVIGLGKLKDPSIENLLLSYAARERALPELRVLVQALGKVGGPRSAEWLASQSTTDGHTQRLLERAQLMLSRTSSRPSELRTLDLSVPLPQRYTLVLHCRAGLESVLQQESRSLGEAQVARGCVTIADYAGALVQALVPRVALHIGVRMNLDRNFSLHQAVVEALRSGRLLEWMTQVSAGPPRVRLTFLGHGHQRAAMWDLQTLMVREGLPLVTDPTRAAWDLVIDSPSSELDVIPKQFDDPRFTWRCKDVPAASHPTIAAALAQVAGTRPDDVVWDPFVGSGLELVERGLLGPYRAMYGTDIDESALIAAKANLAAAEIKYVTLLNRDATTAPVRDITLVITNPPMGARLARDGTLGDLLEATLAHGWRVMRPESRWVWLSPMPARTASVAHHMGFDVERRGLVDLGGLSPELQILRVPGRATSRYEGKSAGSANLAPLPQQPSRKRRIVHSK